MEDVLILAEVAETIIGKVVTLAIIFLGKNKIIIIYLTDDLDDQLVHEIERRERKT